MSATLPRGQGCTLSVVADFNGANVEYVLTYWVDDAAKMGKVNADMRLMLLREFENQEVPVA
jgi:hypothetical protein